MAQVKENISTNLVKREFELTFDYQEKVKNYKKIYILLNTYTHAININ